MELLLVLVDHVIVLVKHVVTMELVIKTNVQLVQHLLYYTIINVLLVMQVVQPVQLLLMLMLV